MSSNAGSLDGIVQLLPFCFKLVDWQVCWDASPLRPTDDDAGEGLWYEEAIPRVDHPRLLGLQVKCADGCARCLRKLNRPHLGLIDWASRAVGGEDCGATGLNDLLKSEQAFARITGTGSAYGIEAKHLEDARDQLAVEALADENDCIRFPKVEGTGKHALVPEAVDFRAGLLPEENWSDTLFRDHLEAPRSTEEP